MSEESLSPLGKKLQREVERMKGTDLTPIQKAILVEFEAQVADDARLQERFTRQLAANDHFKLERLRNGDYKEALMILERTGNGP